MNVPRPLLAVDMPGPRDVLEALASLAPAAAWSLAIVTLTYLGARFASGRLRGVLQRGGFKLNVAILLARTLWLSVWIVGFVLVLYQFGIGLTPLAAFIGIVGLAASLSLQQVLQNLVAGVYLLAERPFEIGDFVSLVGPTGLNHEGRVEDIQMRTTHLRTRDGELVLVPNSAVFSGVVTNRTAVGGFVRHVRISFPRNTDIEDVRARVLPLLKSLSSVLDNPPPQLRLDSVAKDDWTACVSIWARSHEASSDAVLAIAEAFPDATVNDGMGTT